MSRAVRSPWLVALVVAFLLGAPLWYASCMRTNASLAASPPRMPAVPMQQPPPPQSPATDLTDALLRSGFDAKALTAVGLSANGAAAFVAAFRSAYAIQSPVFDAADTYAFTG